MHAATPCLLGVIKSLTTFEQNWDLLSVNPGRDCQQLFYPFSSPPAKLIRGLPSTTLRPYSTQNITYSLEITPGANVMSMLCGERTAEGLTGVECSSRCSPEDWRAGEDAGALPRTIIISRMKEQKENKIKSMCMTVKNGHLKEGKIFQIFLEWTIKE